MTSQARERVPNFTGAQRCERCQGTGRVPRHPEKLRAYGGAWMTEEKFCPDCYGSGFDASAALKGGDDATLRTALASAKKEIARAEARGMERAARIADAEADRLLASSREAAGRSAEAGDDAEYSSVARGHKAVAARDIAAAIRAEAKP